MVNKWKITAIIFIILFVVETTLVIFFLSLGFKIIGNENECAINICDDAISYYYDDYESMCYCYNAKDELIKQEYLK